MSLCTSITLMSCHAWRLFWVGDFTWRVRMVMESLLLLSLWLGSWDRMMSLLNNSCRVWFHATVLFLELRLVGKGRNPQSQITVLKAIVQATGDSLGARVSETLGYQKRQGSGRKRYLFVSMVCIHQLHAHISSFIYMICATYLGCIRLCPV